MIRATTAQAGGTTPSATERVTAKSGPSTAGSGQGEIHHRVPGWSAAKVGLTISAVLLAIATVGELTGASSPMGKAYTFTIVAAVAFTILGALVAPRQPDNRVTYVFVGIALASALVVVSAAFSRYRPMEWLNQWSSALAYGLFPLLLLVFPDGRLPSRSWRPLAISAVAGLVVGAGGQAVAAWEVPGLLVDVDAPRTPLAIAAMRVARVGLLVVVVSLVAAIASVVVRFRRSRGDTRQQLKWLGLGGALVAVAVGIDVTGVPHVGEVVAAASIPATAAIAILKYRLYDIDLFLNRSLVYAVLTLLVVAAYAVVATLVGAVVAPRASWAPAVVAAGAVALLFQPLREWVQRRANRLLYGDRDNPYAVLSGLGRRLEQSMDPGTVLANVVEAVSEALQLPYAAIELRSADGGRLAASFGRAGVIEAEEFRLIYQGRVVGTLLVTPRTSGQPFSTSERRLLADLARQAGVAAHAVRLTDDLQRSRDRLVRSREEERRRLRRDLHDGLGPALAGMTMQIGATRAHLAPDNRQMGEVLGRLEEQLQGCILEIRRLIDDLRPPALDDVGLIEGIRRQVSAFGDADAGAPAIRIQAPADLGELPAAVEVAAYRIAVEAVTNAVRHGKAQQCQVHIEVGEELVIEVADDGVGLAADHRQGVGLASMRERAEELGGKLIADGAPGSGTRVRAELPLVAS